jgi:hypothetical protein
VIVPVAVTVGAAEMKSFPRPPVTRSTSDLTLSPSAPAVAVAGDPSFATSSSVTRTPNSRAA